MENEILTHEKPVFDAEGVRICKGDTVWQVDDTNYPASTVGKIEPEYGRVQILDGCGHVCGAVSPSSLTHREPDSLEKLRDDISNCNGDYVEWGSRLTALIERDAK